MIRRLVRKAPLLAPFVLLVLAGFAGWGLYHVGYILFTDPVDRIMAQYQPGASAAEHQLLANDLLALGPRAVPGLLRWMQGKDRVTRGFAADVLRRLGPQGRDALPSLYLWMSTRQTFAETQRSESAHAVASAMVTPADAPQLITLACASASVR
jgi:hypothetical protein